MLQRREEEMNKGGGAPWMKRGGERKMASGEERLKGGGALHSLTGWVRKDGRDSSADSKWFATQAIKQKYKRSCVEAFFGENISMCLSRGCDWISA